MIDVTTRIEIARTVPEVFAYVADQTNAPQWQTELRGTATHRRPCGGRQRARVRPDVRRAPLRLAQPFRGVRARPVRRVRIRPAGSPAPRPTGPRPSGIQARCSSAGWSSASAAAVTGGAGALPRPGQGARRDEQRSRPFWSSAPALATSATWRHGGLVSQISPTRTVGETSLPSLTARTRAAPASSSRKRTATYGSGAPQNAPGDGCRTGSRACSTRSRASAWRPPS